MAQNLPEASPSKSLDELTKQAPPAGSVLAEQVSRSRFDSSRTTPPGPRSGRTCERRELLASFDQNLHTQVTLIIAPAGYGKTTLIAQWCSRLADQQIAVAYYSAIERERDPAIFLHMIAVALARADVETIGATKWADGGPSDVSLDNILLSLELAGQQITLIIDDFERINEPVIGALLMRLIAEAPPSLHIVIASRNLPTMPMAALEVSGRLRLIDAYQLRLSREELAWMIDLDPDSAELTDIVTRTEGWPVTAELYRLWRSRCPPDDVRATFGGHVAEVHDYLTEQLFSSLPHDQYELLVDIADRDEVSADLVDTMRGRHDSALLLNAIAKTMSSLMWTGHDHDMTIYKLHPLLLGHLRHALEIDGERRQRLSMRAAHWLFDHHNYSEAIRTAVASRDPGTLETIIRALRPIHILVADAAATLRMILRELDDGTIARHPRLQIMAALAHFKAGLFPQVLADIARLREATKDFSVDPDGRPEWLMSEGNLTELIALCQVSRCGNEVDKLREAVLKAATDPVIWGACEIVLMFVHQVRGQFDEADAAVQRARDIYNSVELSRYGHTQILGNEVLILVARGRLRRAVEVIAAYQKQPIFEVADDFSTPTLLRLLLAAIRYEQEFSDAAVESLRSNFAEHSRSESWLDQYAITYSALVMRLYIRDGPQAAFDMIAEGQERAKRIEFEALPDYLTTLEIEFRARSGDSATSRQLAEAMGLEACVNALDPLASRRGWRELDAVRQAWCFLCLSERRYDDALAAALELARAGRIGGRLRAEIKGFVIAALVLQIQGDLAAAAIELHKAVLLAYPERFVAPFAEEGRALLPVIEAAIAVLGLDAFAKRHLDEVRRAISNAMSRTEPNQLNAREREIVDYLAEGLSNKVIARRMGITDHTVKFHLKKVFAKLDVSTRRAAVAKVQAHNLSD
jgi:LuxR family maltose regulon positive regulatory protein